MNNRPPLSESLNTPVISNGWSNWFTQVFLGLTWVRSFNATATLNFGSIAANSQAALTVTATVSVNKGLFGVRQGDAVQITPYADVSGLVFTGVVTADNVVTVYAKNITTGAIDPASQVYRIAVLQN